MALVFLTWGDDKYAADVSRLTHSVRASGLFDAVHGFLPRDMASVPGFAELVAPLAAKYRRGWGLWSAKPLLTAHVLASMCDGDILVYADASCRYVDKLRGELERQVSLIRRLDGPDNLAFALWHTEEQWTKGDTLGAFGCADRADVRRSRQLAACIWLLRKSPGTVALVRRWLDAFRDEHLVNDAPSTLPNAARFREHRHDQSVWSILRKLHPRTLVLDDNTSESDRARCRAPLQTRHFQPLPSASAGSSLDAPTR